MPRNDTRPSREISQTGDLKLGNGAKVLIGLGANLPGPWGEPDQTIRRALNALTRHGVTVACVSPFYKSAPVGQTGQAAYINAAAVLRTHRPPAALLRLLKEVERSAGRRGGRPWGSRTLDIDILDYAGLVTNWRGRKPLSPGPGRRALVLPHPQIHSRPFVLQPLLDISPRWRHPVLKRSAHELHRRIGGKGKGRVQNS